MACGRLASYGPPTLAVGEEGCDGSVTRALFCAIHRLAWHRSIHSTRCSHATCASVALYGSPGAHFTCVTSTKVQILTRVGGLEASPGASPRRCSLHQLPADIDLRHASCGAQGCKRAATYGLLLDNSQVLILTQLLVQNSYTARQILTVAAVW